MCVSRCTACAAAVQALLMSRTGSGDYHANTSMRLLPCDAECAALAAAEAASKAGKAAARGGAIDDQANSVSGPDGTQQAQRAADQGSQHSKKGKKEERQEREEERRRRQQLKERQASVTPAARCLHGAEASCSSRPSRHTSMPACPALSHLFLYYQRVTPMGSPLWNWISNSTAARTSHGWDPPTLKFRPDLIPPQHIPLKSHPNPTLVLAAGSPGYCGEGAGARPSCAAGHPDGAGHPSPAAAG